MGLVAGSSLMYGAIVEVYASQPFVGGAIVIGTSENQKVSCSTGSSKNTHGLQFSANTRDGIPGLLDIAFPFPVQKPKADTYIWKQDPENL